MQNPNPFLITGLPRSRTAWMSVFFTTSNSICYHEPIARLREIEDARSIYDRPNPKFIGISDANLGFHLTWLLENIAPRTVIIERPLQEVEESIARIGLPGCNYVRLLAGELRRFRNHPLVMWVPFSSLDSLRVMEKIWWHLMPGETFDEDRFALMSKMNIQADAKKAVREYEFHKETVDHFNRDLREKLRIA